VRESRGGGGGAPANAEYLVLAYDPTLTGERLFSLAPRLAGTDNGPNNTYTVDLAVVVGLVPGSYTNADVTVDTYGRVTSVTNGSLAVAGGWTDAGTVVYLTTSTDQVGIGTTTPNATYKTHIRSDAGIVNGLYLEGGTSGNDRVIGVQPFGVTGLAYMMQSNAIEYWGAGTTPATAFDFRAYRDGANSYLWDRQGVTPMLFTFEDTLRTNARRVAQTTITAAALAVGGSPQTYDVILCDPTANPQTITLPNPGTAGNLGRRYTIKRVSTSANTVTVATAAGTIDGAPTRVLAGGTYDAITVVNDGTNWWII
jgi:hypothetical protein